MGTAIVGDDSVDQAATERDGSGCLSHQAFAELLAHIWFVQLEEGMPLASVAKASGLPQRSIQRRVRQIPQSVRDALRQGVAYVRDRDALAARSAT